MNELKFKYNIDEKPEKKSEQFVLSIQHVFAMFGSTILVPTLIGIDISVALFTAGLGTLLYMVASQFKVPVFIGSSFAYIPILAHLMITSGAGAVAFAVMSVGVIYMIVSIIIKIFGINWIEVILPPVVIGPIIIIIGLSLAPVAIANSGLIAESNNYKSIIISMSTLLIASFAMLKGSNFSKSIPIIIGIIGGYIISILLNEVDLSLIFSEGLLSMPNFQIPFISYDPEFNINILMAIIPIVLITLSEHIGDHAVSSAIMNKNFFKDPGLKRTILGDGLATFCAGLLGGPVNTTYAENTGVIIMTRVASISVIKYAAFMSMILAFIAPITNFIASIPIAVMGGISILLFGMIAQNGIKILIDAKINLFESRNLIIISSILVFGIGGAGISFLVFGITFDFTNLTLAAIVGIIFHLILPNKKISYAAKK